MGDRCCVLNDLMRLIDEAAIASSRGPWMRTSRTENAHDVLAICEASNAERGRRAAEESESRSGQFGKSIAA